jgi:putative aldouronate transport system substrate-binding protein
MKSKKYIIIIVIIFISSIVFSQIRLSRNKDVMKNNEIKKSPLEKVRLSVCMPQNAWAGETLDPTLVNSIKVAMENSNNIEIELIAPNHDNYNESLDKMVASGDIPDIYLLRRAMNMLQLYTVKGYTKDITELVEKDDNIQKTINKTYIDYMRVNGQIHGVPKYQPSTKVIWLRKDIIQEDDIKLSETPTTDEFLTEMKKIAHKDIIPFSFTKFLDNLAFFYNAFNASGGIDKKANGEYYDGFNAPEARQALSYMRTLYKEGIWDKEYATNENIIVRNKLILGKCAANIDYVNRYIYYMSEGGAKNSSFDLQPIYMLKGPKGGQGNLNEGIQDALLVSSKCKNPEAAVSLLSWMTTSEAYAKMNIVGIEGKHYTVENGVIKSTEAAKASGYKAAATNFTITHKRVTDFGFKWDPITEKYMPKQESIAKENSKYTGPNTIIPGGISPLYDNNAVAYNEKVQKLASRVIMGTISIENCYKEYKEFWNSIKGDEMLAELNKGK